MGKESPGCFDFESSFGEGDGVSIDSSALLLLPLLLLRFIWTTGASSLSGNTGGLFFGRALPDEDRRYKIRVDALYLKE